MTAYASQLVKMQKGWKLIGFKHDLIYFTLGIPW